MELDKTLIDNYETQPLTSKTNKIDKERVKSSNEIEILFEKEEKKNELKEELKCSISPPILIDESQLNSKKKQVFEFYRKKKRTIFELEYEDCFFPSDNEVFEEDDIRLQREIKKANEMNFEEFNSQVIINKGFDRKHRHIIIFNQSVLIDNTPNFPQKFYFFVLKSLQFIYQKEFVIIYINKMNQIPYGIFEMLYLKLPNQIKSNIYKIYSFISPSISLKQINFIKSDDLNKFVVVKDLFEFFKDIPMGTISIPHEFVESLATYHPIFGIPLSEAVHHPFRGSTTAPLIIECAIMYFSSKVEVISIEGIFRMAGSKQRIEQLIKEFNCGIRSEFEEDEDPHVVCSLLKHYLRSLPTPLLTYQIGDEIAELFKNDTLITEDKINSIIKKLPEENKSLLYHLVVLGKIICNHVSENKMSTSNMGIMFGPCIYWSEITNIEAISKAKNISLFFTYLLDHADKILATE
ncbi:RhoGAP domain containing protein [Entamoeba histolytica HM-1:IMSS-B]|uniref:RhoGAP domain containing protein n=5 Tax=Entamoeba histolytica TaxID=5759 RepID=C4M2C8_ENTH1|nr:RhoGAP domain containing protein [Entamoeba histolytica HM-1:IMSS]EMH72183.1 RhoGAP domain containing protein [Entamoeba histolytica HM-1:IMSS-B]EMS14644.1 RhoGAP domain containing protein [Entamoeba histolytica HM-3:IMSS]ENY60929.1 RhoGAP domain containing protein [Entamoeba histolytica HM-1:IMSS-A]GAT95430.1 rhogap domain containing protein [Entamoeba histolytica]EAL45419.1 RhoGAP domain containing protein [Entamoeba histolytica HM-1:IMSS]|eukprot:XP_650805.1 RhoGAP domain containing protein [Entamoeba histolytica HM-1:IMSS]